MVGERWTIYTFRDGSLGWVPCLRFGERAKVLDEPAAVSPGGGIRSAVLVDDDGTEWLVISKTRTEEPSRVRQ